MAERKLITIEPESDTARLLRQLGDEPVSIVSEGVKYRIEREPADPFATYDAANVLASLRGGIGLYEGVDVEQLKQDIWEQRAQNSKGRPAE